MIESVEEYEVLNVCVRYGGGVVVYLNGKMVARLNVYEEFSLETESIVSHDPTTFSKFHIIVVGSGAMKEKNVIAFEIHRPIGWWWLREFAFDARGMFGVDTCSFVLDSYDMLSGSDRDQGEFVDAMNLYLVWIGKVDKLVVTNMEWIV